MSRLCVWLAALGLLAGCADDAPRPVSATAPQPAATARATAFASAHLGVPGFWRVVETTRKDAGDDTGRQSELLAERLHTLPAQQIADFGALRRRLDERAYTWDLWAAAYVIEDGCSDDCFRDFRGYLISLGRGPYEAALKKPDSLARVAQDAETGDWEDADNVAPEVYSDVTGEDMPSGDSDLSGEPRGTPWDDEQQDELVQRYPALAARFR